MTNAIFEPSGDHTGPSFSRVPIEWFGTRIEGSIRCAPHRHLHQFVGAFTEPARVRMQQRDDDRRAIRGPRRPARLVEWRVNGRALVSDSDCAVVLDEHELGAVGRPGGHRRIRGQEALGAVLHVVDPEVHRARAVRREGEQAAVRRPGRIDLDEAIVRDAVRRAANRHHPQIAERGEGDLPAIGREDRRHDPAHGARGARVEVAPLEFVGCSRERDRCAELDRRDLARSN